MSRRWQADGRTIRQSGLLFRVIEGEKFPGDLVLQWKAGGEWVKVEMAAVALMVDFLVENEDARRAHQPHWRETGWDYFVGFLRRAVERGWEEAAGVLAQQRVVAETRKSGSDVFDPLSIEF